VTCSFGSFVDAARKASRKNFLLKPYFKPPQVDK